MSLISRNSETTDASLRSQRLADLEDRIKLAVYDVCMALADIRDEKLYLDAGYSNFSEYCLDKWNYKKSHAYELANAGSIMNDLKPLAEEGLLLPTASCQVRALNNFQSPNERRDIWRKVNIELEPGRDITAEHVNSIVREYFNTEQGDSSHQLGFFAESDHTKAQLVLAQLALHIGLKVWVAKDNRAKIQSLDANLSDVCLNKLPNLGIGEDAQKVVEYIDLLWLNEQNHVIASFEIEQTTSIYSGLLRISDLISLCPNLAFSNYIVIPKARVDRVIQQLERPTFRKLKLSDSCKWIEMEELFGDWENGSLKKFASFQVIEQISHGLDV